MDVKQLALQCYGPQLSCKPLWGEIHAVVVEIRLPPRDGDPEGGVADKLICDTAGFSTHRARMDVKQLALQCYGLGLSLKPLCVDIHAAVVEIRFTPAGR